MAEGKRETERNHTGEGACATQVSQDKKEEVRPKTQRAAPGVTSTERALTAVHLSGDRQTMAVLQVTHSHSRAQLDSLQVRPRLNLSPTPSSSTHSGGRL